MNYNEKYVGHLSDNLQKNNASIKKWTDYSEALKQTMLNLDKFRERLTWEIQIPIGNKAFMPGTLIHTNDVLVNLGCDYMAKCSVEDAKTLCRRRLADCEQFLKDLNRDKDIIVKKMETIEEDSTGIEIVEEYNEEKEAEWRKNRKMKTIKEDEVLEDTTGEMEQLMQKLDELEMEEELQDELDRLEIKDESLTENTPDKSTRRPLSKFKKDKMLKKT